MTLNELTLSEFLISLRGSDSIFLYFFFPDFLFDFKLVQKGVQCLNIHFSKPIRVNRVKLLN